MNIFFLCLYVVLFLISYMFWLIAQSEKIVYLNSMCWDFISNNISKEIPYSEELFERREGEGKLLYYSQSLTEAKAKQMRRGRRVVLWPGLEQPEPARATHN